MNYPKLIIAILFFLVISRCTDTDTVTDSVTSTSLHCAQSPSGPNPVEINVEDIVFPESGSRSGILLQTVDFPASGTQYNYLSSGQATTHKADNHDVIDSCVYKRWNINDANFGTFIGSNYTKTKFYKDGSIKLDSVVSTIAYGDTFTIKRPSQPILKDGMTGKVYSWTRTMGYSTQYLQYRGETVNLTIWDHKIDGISKEVRSKPPETSKTRQWQLRHVM